MIPLHNEVSPEEMHLKVLYGRFNDQTLLLHGWLLLPPGQQLPTKVGNGMVLPSIT